LLERRIAEHDRFQAQSPGRAKVQCPQRGPQRAAFLRTAGARESECATNETSPPSRVVNLTFPAGSPLG
jgi:hypothetical protein